MKFAQRTIFFLSALSFHIMLVYLFASGFYTFYFIALIGISYLLHSFYSYFSYRVFLLLLILVLILVNLNLYDEYVFELYLYFDAVKYSIFVNSEVKYVLITLHLIVLINLKRFENFWAIIDKKLFRI